MNKLLDEILPDLNDLYTVYNYSIWKLKVENGNFKDHWTNCRLVYTPLNTSSMQNSYVVVTNLISNILKQFENVLPVFCAGMEKGKKCHQSNL